jgi:hypothetical protein
MGHGVKIGIGIVIGICLIMVLMMGACVACGGLMLGIGSRKAERQAASPSTDPASLPRVGQRVEKSGVALTVERASKSKSLSRFETADQNSIYLVVDILLETTGRDEAPYNPFYFKVKDSDGIEYNVALSGSKEALSSGTLYKGDKVRGKVGFEVREKAGGFVLTYTPLVIFGGYDPIRIALD